MYIVFGRLAVGQTINTLAKALISGSKVKGSFYQQNTQVAQIWRSCRSSWPIYFASYFPFL